MIEKDGYNDDNVAVKPSTLTESFVLVTRVVRIVIRLF